MKFAKGQLIRKELKMDGALHYTFRINPHQGVIHYLKLGGYAKICYEGSGDEDYASGVEGRKE